MGNITNFSVVPIVINSVGIKLLEYSYWNTVVEPIEYTTKVYELHPFRLVIAIIVFFKYNTFISGSLRLHLHLYKKVIVYSVFINQINLYQQCSVNSHQK